MSDYEDRMWKDREEDFRRYSRRQTEMALEKEVAEARARRGPQGTELGSGAGSYPSNQKQGSTFSSYCSLWALPFSSFGA
jgi:hypothetical protein